MVIWIVCEGEPLPSDKGEVRLRRMGLLSKILVEEGHEVHWFSSSFHHYKKTQRSEKDEDIVLNKRLNIHLLRSKGYKKNISVSRITHHKRIAKKFSNRSVNYNLPDIIIATMAPLELSEAAVNFANKNSIPVVIDIRDLWPEIYGELVPEWGKTLIQPYIKYSKRKLTATLSNSTSLIAVTQKFLKYGQSLINNEKSENDKVFYTSYPPMDSTGEKTININWLDSKISRTDFIVTFMGNFGKQFVLDPIIETAEMLKEYKNIKFVLCGNGENLERIKIDARNLPNVLLPGWIEKREISSLLSLSSVGIAPYRNSINFTHNIPNKFGEYLSFSLPILLGVNGSMAELANEYDCGMLYKDSNDLKDIILKLYDNENLKLAMSQNAKKLYNEKFNSDIVYKEMADYLINIAEN
ncbi:glycosyltransferase family 4 protein [Rossellomorea aquimaris]|uniref:Glycosyltransferase involved in cell wall biosynthesis n=1 Tax=Rossellomorea aquimaris TaxID=189382 RepID=A0A366EQN3_9BACI|nr:glycosyltransferase family 4 protein [Rossellomorea aquimaris]RBP04723.1 glycosyltransferase involved in cell wall biosynthesis [Rossellomorea aquimaris]